jgi:hypothetical protein
MKCKKCEIIKKELAGIAISLHKIYREPFSIKLRKEGLPYIKETLEKLRKITGIKIVMED